MQNNSPSPISAIKNLEAQLGPEISRQLAFDYSSKLKDPVRRTTISSNTPALPSNTKGTSNRNSIESGTTNDELTNSISDTSITSSTSNQPSPQVNVKSSKLNKPPEQLDEER